MAFEWPKPIKLYALLHREEHTNVSTRLYCYTYKMHHIITNFRQRHVKNALIFVRYSGVFIHENTCKQVFLLVLLIRHP